MAAMFVPLVESPNRTHVSEVASLAVVGLAPIIETEYVRATSTNVGIVLGRRPVL